MVNFRRRRAAARGRAGRHEGRRLQRTHVYGLTEVYGPAVVNEWHAAWDALPLAEQAARNRARACATRCWKRSTYTIPHAGAGCARQRDARRSDDARQCGDEGYRRTRPRPQRRSKAAGPHRRSRRHVPGRLRPAEGPLQGHHHFRRREFSSIESRTRSTNTRRSWLSRWWPSPTTNGARRPAPSSS